VSGGRQCVSCGLAPLVSRRYARTWDLPRYRIHYGRGLCTPCGESLNRRGLLDEFERSTRRSVDLVEDALILRARHPGMTWAEIARQLGVTAAALSKARERVSGSSSGPCSPGPDLRRGVARPGSAVAGSAPSWLFADRPVSAGYVPGSGRGGRDGN
jgi:hypothetical protein